VNFTLFIVLTYQPAVRHPALIVKGTTLSDNSLDKSAPKRQPKNENLDLASFHSPNITARRHNIRLASTKEQRYGHKPEKSREYLSR
jgi:hypothetical protein